MVYTVTFSPALDYVMRLDSLKIGEVNRAESEETYAGGKGINVAKVLTALGVDCVALGFIAGFTGDEIERLLKIEGVKTDFITTAGITRINVKLKAESETDINGRGEAISEDNLRELFERIDALKDGDTIVLAGTVPPGLPDNIYEQILARVSGKGVYKVVDATKDLLLRALEYKPFLIKPNKAELEEMLGVKAHSKEDVIKYARQLCQMGAKNVIVSLAGDGAVMATEEGEVYDLCAPEGKVVNSVGSGDSMVAGFIAGIKANMSKYDSFRLGVAAGSATAFSEGLADKEGIIKVLQRIGN